MTSYKKGTTDCLTLLQSFVYDHGQLLNSFPTSNNKMFSLRASAIQCGALKLHKPFNLNIFMGPGTLTQGPGPPLGSRTLILGEKPSLRVQDLNLGRMNLKTRDLCFK